MLAEAVTVDMGTLLTIGGIVFGAGGVIAGLKIKQALAKDKAEAVGKQSEKAQEKLERVDDKIFDEIKNLGKTMQRQFREQNDKQAEAEKSMVGKLDNFQSKVFHRLDDMQGQISEQDKRLSLAESEAGHIKEKVERHAKKITLFGRSPLKPDE